MTRLSLEPLEERVLLTFSSLGELIAGDTIAGFGSLSAADDVDHYEFTVPEPGRVTIEVDGYDEFDSRLRLFAKPVNKQINADNLDDLLSESDDRALGDLNPRLDLHLRPSAGADGTQLLRYDFSVSATSADVSMTTGDYRFSIEFVPATSPFKSVENFESPVDIVTADFNGDGIPDLATANRDSDDVSVLLGLGDGTFSTRRETIAVGTRPFAMVVGHFNDDNGDGKLDDQDFLDLAVVNQIDKDVSVLLGTGDGKFTETQCDSDGPERCSVGLAPEAIASVDLDGDGYLDLAIANGGSDDISILWNDKTGAFGQRQDIPVGDDPRDIVAADFDKDGHMDLAITNRNSDNVVILMNKGTRTFKEKDHLGDDNPIRYEVNQGPHSLVTGQFNDDNADGAIDDQDYLDLAVVSDNAEAVTILLGKGDGDFIALQDPDGSLRKFQVGTDAENIVTNDFDQDGILDLIVANEFLAGDLSVLLGRGDGTFEEQFRVAVGSDPQSFVAGHFNDDNGDGKLDDQDRLDLAVPNRGSDDITILLGQADGTFIGRRSLVGNDPESIVTADFNGDGRLDIATANRISDNVSILFGSGYGSFEPEVHFAVGGGPWALVAVDLDRDGKPDIATADRYSDSVTILWGSDNGAFQPQVPFGVGEGPSALIVDDLDGDGHLDLATHNEFSHDFSVLWGLGDRKFHDERRFEKADDPFELSQYLESERHTSETELSSGRFNPDVVITADLNGDGYADLVTANRFVQEISVRLNLGQGDGSFGQEMRFRTPEKDPTHLVAGHFNDDDDLDLAIVQGKLGKVSILFGLGDGQFPDNKESIVVDVGRNPEFVVTGDFNSDGQLDLAVANSRDDNISILIGSKNGMFEELPKIAVGVDPERIAVGHFNDDTLLDLAVANRGDDNLSILLGQGNGEFREVGDDEDQPVRPKVGTDPFFVVAGQFNDDNADGAIDDQDYLDLATANQIDGSVTILLGQGNGKFTLSQTVREGLRNNWPRGLATGDFDNDGLVDLVVANEKSNEVIVLRGLGGEEGKFEPLTNAEGEPERFSVGTTPWFVASADFDGDGDLDVVTSNKQSNNVSVLLSHGDGRFAESRELGVGSGPETRVMGDFNGDGKVQTAIATRRNEVTVDGPIGVLGPIPLKEELNGDGLVDIVTVNHNGEILLRLGLLDPMKQVAFTQLQIVYESGDPIKARDVAVVTTKNSVGSTEIRLAVLERSSSQSNNLKLYSLRFDEDANFLLQGAEQLGDSIPISFNPSRIVAGEWSGDDHDDLILLSEKSGDISLLESDGKGGFVERQRLRAGRLVYDGLWDTNSASADVLSSEGASDIATGDFNNDGIVDLVVTSVLSSRASILFGKNSGGFVDPVPILLRRPATQIVAGDVNGDGHADLVLLHSIDAEISILWGTEIGEFKDGPVIGNAGNSPEGIFLDDMNDDGILDLLVVSQFGDLLVLQGNPGATGLGDGTFRDFTQVDRAVTLAVSDHPSASESVIVANRARHSVTVNSADIVADQLSAPEDVIFVDVNRDDIDDLIVANSGNDEVLVYLGRIDGSFNATALPYRDNNPNDLRDGPSGITSADLNEDGYMDLIVTNFGSNSVSLLLNKGTDTDGRWEGFTLESRLDVGLGPVSTVVRDVTGDGLNDLLVTNSQAGTVELLPSTSDGLFNGRRDSVTLPGPTGRQGAVYGTHEAFVALADGSVVKFALDTFQTGQDFGRIVMQPRSGRAAISVVTALQPANIDGDVESELFVTGFDADGRAVTALFDNTSSIVFDELQRWAPAELVSPGDLVVLPGSEGQFELFVAQDSVQVPFVRILTSTFALLLPGTNSVTTVSLPFLALAALRFSDLTASTLDFDALSVSSVDELDGQYASVNSLKGLIEELVGTLNGAITNVLSGLSNLLHPLLHSVEEALGSQLVDQVLTGLVDAVKDVVARSFPGLTAMELAWRILTDESIDLASPKESIAADRPPSTDAITVNEIIMELAENIRAMMRDYSVPALAQHDAKTARFFARQLRELVFETIAQVKKEFDVLPAELSLALPDERSWKLNQALNVIAASLFLAGTAGLLWHYFDRPRTAE